MDPTPLAPWRDLSIVWFSLWMMLFVAIPGVVFYFMLKYLRRFNRWLKLPLMNAQVWALRIQYGTQHASEKIVDVPIRVYSASARLQTTARGVIDFLLGE
jgi:hypothetical protein